MSRSQGLVVLIGLALVAVLPLEAGRDRAEAKRHGAPEYIALGDEIAIGVGLSDPNQSYVSLFHEFLTGRRGLRRETEMRNLAADNQSIFDVAGLQLPVALAEIEARNTDSDKKNDVRVVTIDAGLVDLFGGLLVCREDPLGACVDFIDEKLVWHEFFMNYILDALRTAGGPGLKIIVMTNYNPFLNPQCYFNFLVPTWDAALEGSRQLGITEGINDITRRVAPEYGARVADVYGRVSAEHLPTNCDTDSPDAEGHATVAAEFARAFAAKKSR